MSRELVEQWIRRLPSIERSQPLVILGDSAYSPNQVLDEVTRGTPIGSQLQGIIEQRRFTEAIDKYALAPVSTGAQNEIEESVYILVCLQVVHGYLPCLFQIRQ